MFKMLCTTCQYAKCLKEKCRYAKCHGAINSPPHEVVASTNLKNQTKGQSPKNFFTSVTFIYSCKIMAAKTLSNVAVLSLSPVY